MNGKAMTAGAPWKHILRFALPVFLGNLLQQLYNTVDAIVVGNFASEEALSAVGTTGTVTFMLLALAIGFSAGNGVVVAQHYGAGDEKQVRANASTGIIFIMALGLIITLVGLFAANPIFSGLVGVPEEIIDQTLAYFRIYAIGIIFQFGYNIFSSILRAVGDSASTLYFLLIASVLNIILDLIFVAVFKWGVVGAAVATVIAQVVSFFAAYIYMSKKYPVFRFKLREYSWRWSLAKRTIIVGFPIALQMFIVSFGLTFIQRAVNGFGKTMIASFTVGQRMEMYLNIPCSTLQTTMATYTGQNIGAGRMDRVKLGARQAIVMSLFFTLLISSVVWVLSGNITDLFGLTNEAKVFCIDHIRTVAFVNIILSLYIPLFGVFQGANHTGAPTITATGALSVRVFVTYLLRYSSFFGYTIIWWNGLFGFGMGFLITWTYYLSGKWQKNSLIST